MGAPVVHFEIGCRDRAKTGQFFGKLFDWKMEEFGDATMVDTGNESGIAGHIAALGHEPHNYVTFYVQVDDLDAKLKEAEELGAKTLVPPQEIPGMGHFAWFADPEGTPIGLWKPIGEGN